MTEYPQFIKESWIGKFIEYSRPLPTPEIFRKWSSISCVMGALERRVWVRTAYSVLFPNHYVILIAPPGVGKSMIINEVSRMWASVGCLKIGPDAATKAAMVDALSEATRTFKLDGETHMMQALQIASSEFGNLIHEYANETMNFYNKMWDCPEHHSERLRYGEKKCVDLDYVQVNMLAGTQPAYLGSILPTEAFGMGYTARLVLVYCARAVRPDLFPEEMDDKAREADRQELVSGLRKIVELAGEFTFTAEAKTFIKSWYESNDGPDHPKLESYRVRRPMTIQKIAMAVSAACGLDLLIQKEHIEFALELMLEAETFMPEIFKGMVVPETSNVMAELYNYLIAKFAKIKAPVPEHLLIDFLKSRVEINKIDLIMKHMVTSNLMKEAPSSSTEGGKFQTFGKRFIPVKRNEV